MYKKQSVLKAKTPVTIIRRKMGMSNIHGYLLDGSREWLLVQNIYDFHLNGYSIIRRKDIKKLRYDDRDKCFESILKKEGVTKKVINKYKIRLDDIKTILECLKKIKLHFIIECEERKDDIFVIGKIAEIKNDFLIFNDYDACGKWRKEHSIITYSKITIIRFDEEYINIFSKYVIRPPKHLSVGNL